ncbi:MAG: hypothetical protein AAGJ18_19170 [Bacteroidota bacterium]
MHFPHFAVRKKWRLIALASLCSFVNLSLYSQIKFEREYRLKAVEVPSQAQQYVIALGAKKKIKWYKEISQDGKSIEAKTKIRAHCYSIEFSEVGELEDVEIKIDWDEIAETTQQNIKNHLKSIFKKYKIKKIQRQFTGDAASIKAFLIKQKVAENCQIRYEIVVKGRNEKGVRLYEILFAEDGQFLKSLPIELRNTDNLEY